MSGLTAPRATLPAMAKVTCPLCSSKLDPDGNLYPNHLEDSAGSLCPMSIRIIEGREHDGPVTDGGQAPAAL